MFEAEKPQTPCCVLLCITEILHSCKCEVLLIASRWLWNGEIHGPLSERGLRSSIWICFEGMRVNLESVPFFVKALQAFHSKLPEVHKVSAFALLWNLPGLDFPGSRDRDIPFLARLITQGVLRGLLFDGLHPPSPMLPSARYLIFHYPLICFVYFMTAPLGIYFPRRMTRMIHISP